MLSTLQLLSPQPSDHEETPAREELPFISRRLGTLVLLFSLVMALFAGRIYQLTIVEGPKYRDTSENNFQLQEPLIAPRGRILDCKGRPLAINQTLFDIQMSPFHLKNKEIVATLDRLATLLGRPKIRDKAKDVIKLRPRWKTLSLLDGKLVPLSSTLPILEQAYELPGVLPISQYQRCYPAGVLSGSVTGHVASISPKQKDAYETKGYLPDEKIGQLGAEQTFEDLLHGEHGIALVTRDALGRPRDRFLSRACKPGAILTLTLDMDLQRLADQLLGSYNGVIIAMDPRDGAVLAMAAHPNYDPNDPSGQRSPIGTVNSFNKATRGVFAPGSTFKVVTASAGLAAGYSPLDKVECPGYYILSGQKGQKGQKFKCTFTHNDENLYEALQKSCNVFFMTWTYRLRTSVLDMAHAYGFGQLTDFELVSPGQENPGIAGSRSNRPLLGNIVQSGIGQGELIGVTPIQLARAYAALCNGGILYRPRILREAHLPDGTPLAEGHAEEQGRLPLNEHQRSLILEGLRRVVNEFNGTAARYGIKPEWRVSGKTGTAQLGGGKINAWFACFAPAEAPTIELVILVEHSPSHGGTMCAPMARQLLAYYFGQPEPILYPAGTEPPKKTDEAGSTD